MTCNAIATWGDCASKVFVTSSIKSNVTQVPASMTNLFIPETVLRQQQEPSYQFPMWCFIPINERKMVIMGNKMNFSFFKL
jgi:hypothetical protein